jgi:hypothetical protein
MLALMRDARRVPPFVVPIFGATLLAACDPATDDRLDADSVDAASFDAVTPDATRLDAAEPQDSAQPADAARDSGSAALSDISARQHPRPPLWRAGAEPAPGVGWVWRGEPGGDYRGAWCR